MLPEVDGYETLEKIGQGGVGAVYLARSRREPERRVALKFLHDRSALRETDMRRFVREARLGQSLHHAHVLAVHELLESNHGPVLVMDYVPGRPLLAHPRGSSDLRERLLMLASIADALAHLHKHGVVHRDVKPANILVREDGHPFLIDFGLARTLEVDTTVTATGTILGTPAYLAPELLHGESGDHRADLYSFGVTLFEASTGELPFRAPSLPALFEKVLTGEPPALTGLAPHAPHGLERIVNRCLEKRPADRYPNAELLRDDLRRVARGLSPRTSSASLWVRRELRRLQRGRFRIAAGLVLVLGLVAAGLYFGLRRQVGERELEKELESGYVLLDRGDLDQSVAAFDAVERRDPRSPLAAVARADAYAEFELWSRAAEEVRKAHALGYPSGEQATSAEPIYHQAIVDFAEHRYVEADARLVRALALEPELYRAHFLLYHMRYAQGRSAESKQALEECRRNLKEVNPRHAVVTSLEQRMDGRYEDSIETLIQQRSRFSPHAPAWLHRRLGEAYLIAYIEDGGNEAHLGPALNELEAAVKLQPNDGNAWANLGSANFCSGAMDEARRCGERALKCDSKLAVAHRLLAALDAEKKDWVAGLEHLKEARSATPGLFEVSVLIGEFSYQQAVEHYERGASQECFEALSRALADDPENLAALCLRAQTATILKRGEIALTDAMRALDIMPRWKPRVAAGRLPGEVDAEAFRTRLLPSVHIALVAGAGDLDRPLQGPERERVVASLAWLRERAVVQSLEPAVALNLAVCLARVPDDLRDCDEAYRILDAVGLWDRFGGDPAGQKLLDAIEKACP